VDLWRVKGNAERGAMGKISPADFLSPAPGLPFLLEWDLDEFRALRQHKLPSEVTTGDKVQFSKSKFAN
jgi:hypothetical protein